MQDELLEQAKEWSRKKGFVSLSYLQRIMRIGYIRASRLVDCMIEVGFCQSEFMAGSHTHAIIEAVEQLRAADVCHACGKPFSVHSHNRVGHEVCP